jgi:hypothetical protein
LPLWVSSFVFVGSPAQEFFRARSFETSLTNSVSPFGRVFGFEAEGPFGHANDEAVLLELVEGSPRR